MEHNRKKWDALMMAWSAWMADRHPRPLRPTTRKNYVNRIRMLSRIAAKSGHSILTADIRTVRLVLGQKSPHPSTVNGYLSALDCLYRFLVAQQLRKDNPIATMGRPPQQRKIPRPLQWMDAVKYINAAQRLQAHHFAVASFGLMMGLRRTEIRLLQWVDFFDAEKRTWLDLEGKGGKRARLAVPSAIVVCVLPRLREEHNDATWLFPSPRPSRAGEPVCDKTLSDWHRAVLAEAGLKETIALHQLRHSFATHMRRAGVDSAVIQDALRHSDPKSTRIYMQVLPEEIAEAVEKLNFLQNPNKPAAPELDINPAALDEDTHKEIPGQNELFGGETA